MDDKVIIKAIKRSSCKEIENSVYKFEEDLELMQLLDVADGSRDGSVEEEKLEAQAGHHAMADGSETTSASRRQCAPRWARRRKVPTRTSTL